VHPQESSEVAGLDLYSSLNTTVPNKGKRLIPTDLQIKLPEGCYGRIAPLSGLALAHHIDIVGGVIDEDYSGNIGVILYNHSDTAFVVSRGDRIAQLICEKIYVPSLEVESLDSTERGAGFGSGKN
jgi:dUTP pyrophosphatase